MIHPFKCFWISGTIAPQNAGKSRTQIGSESKLTRKGDSLNSMVKVVVLGATGRIDDIDRFLSYLQNLEHGQGLLIDADMVCGKDHLASAANHAVRAFERGDNVSSSLPVETLLYTSGERQISKAAKKMGVKIGSERVALVLFDVQNVEKILIDLGLQRDDDVLDPSVEKALKFGISHDELKAVSQDMIEDLVLERVAFVSLLK
jgi:KEOPS complex subunit Cgi121